ncbi:MAG: hypothetical protein JRI86_13110 [Deltaproteobacteria bacterium]|nr:hypothetical protein [Deltaproteobacteria bacterium]
MNMTEGLEDKILSDFKRPQKEFELYEKFYLGLGENAKIYLKCESKKYKKIVLAIQEVIQPSVRMNCIRCEIHCCKLYVPELSIYIAKPVGCFDLINYLLVRCDTVLPDPCYENMEKNVCPFYVNGCTLPVDCRSYLCIQYFCDKIKKELDMQLISKYLEKAKFVLNHFSVQECMI